MACARLSAFLSCARWGGAALAVPPVAGAARATAGRRPPMRTSRRGRSPAFSFVVFHFAASDSAPQHTPQLHTLYERSRSVRSTAVVHTHLRRTSPSAVHSRRPLYKPRPRRETGADTRAHAHTHTRAPRIAHTHTPDHTPSRSQTGAPVVSDWGLQRKQPCSARAPCSSPCREHEGPPPRAAARRGAPPRPYAGLGSAVIDESAISVVGVTGVGTTSPSAAPPPLTSTVKVLPCAA